MLSALLACFPSMDLADKQTNSSDSSLAKHAVTAFQVEEDGVFKEQVYSILGGGYVYESSPFANYSHDQVRTIEEDEHLSLVSFSSRGQIKPIFENKKTFDGCYALALVESKLNQYEYTIDPIIISSPGSLSTLDQSFDLVFAGDICIEHNHIESISNTYNNKKYDISVFYAFLEQLGLKKISELKFEPGLGVVSPFKRTSFKFNHNNYEVKVSLGQFDPITRKQTLAVQKPDKSKVYYQIPTSRKLDLNAARKAVPENREFSEFLSRELDPDYVVNPPRAVGALPTIPENVPDDVSVVSTGTVKLKHAQEIYSQYSSIPANVRASYVAQSKKVEGAGSTNVVVFSKLPVKALEKQMFVFRAVTEAKRLIHAAFLKNEATIMSILAYKNLFHNPFGRSMTPQPFYIDASGVRSISQKMTPFYSAAYPSSGTYDLVALHKQNRSMAEAIKFLHEPFEFNGKFYKVAHRDLKPENFVVQSKIDPNVGITDYDLSTFLEGTSLDDLMARTRTPFYGGIRGTPLTVDPHTVVRHNPALLNQDPRLKRLLTYEEVEASDIWSLGVSFIWNALPANFAKRESLYQYIINKNVNSSKDLYIKNQYIPYHIEHFFNRPNQDILAEVHANKPNLQFTDLHIEGIRKYLASKEYQFVKNRMLVLDASKRATIDEVLSSL